MTIRYGCFFSYAHGHHAYMSKFKYDLADALKCYLEPHFDTENELFIDSEQLGGGDDLDRRIALAMCESVCMIVICTPKYEAHAYTRREFAAMQQIENERKLWYPLPSHLIIPVIMTRHPLSLPPQITEPGMYVDFSRYTLATGDLKTNVDSEDGAQRALWRRGDPASGISGYQPLFERALGEAYGLSRISLESYFDEMQWQQARSLAGGEPLAVCAEQGGDRFSVTRAFECFLDWFGGGHCPWQSRQEIPLQAAIAKAREAQAGGTARAAALPLARELNRLGELYCRDGRCGQALQCFEESLSLHVRVLGEDHLDTLRARQALTMARLAQGDTLPGPAVPDGDPGARERIAGVEQATPPYLRSGLAAGADAEQADSLGDMMVMVQTLIEREELPHARGPEAS